MTDKQIQIFISYARDDDAQTPGIPDAIGFVDHLHQQMAHAFKNSGRERPQIWRDVDNIFRGERFWPKIQQELDNSNLLIVILSENWMASEFCRKELEYFRQCRERRGEPIDENIIVVAKNEIDVRERPVGLQETEGYLFYRKTGRLRMGPIEDFFVRGKPVANLYWPIFDELCTYLVSKSKYLRRVPYSEVQVPTHAGTVFVAKPASDMLDEYIRVVKELTNHGYNVVPKRSDEMPRDYSALSFIDEALASADASIHLVGESAGWEPEDLPKIVELQLARAAERVGEHTAGRLFLRVIWAPKVFRRTLFASNETFERDPHNVVARYSPELPNDEIIGADPGNFRQSLIHLLDQTYAAKRAEETIAMEPSDVTPGSRVFILHHEKDRLLARNLKKALKAQDVEALLPAVDDDETLRKRFDKESIARSDAIVVCWGLTSQTWTCAQARNFENWRAFGRKRDWKPRSVVLAPPQGDIKIEFKQDPLPREIDQLVELADIETIPVEVVRKIIPRTHAEKP